MGDPSESRNPVRFRWPDLLLFAYACCCLLAVSWPVYPAVARRVGPLLWGVPFALCWHVGWIAASFFALIAYHRASRDERRADERSDLP